VNEFISSFFKGRLLDKISATVLIKLNVEKGRQNDYVQE
jgi:hypothetical protein